MREAYSGVVPPKDSFWRINFSRVNWDFDLVNKRYSRKKDKAGTFYSEYNWVWSAQEIINMHEPERWGYVYFKEDKEQEFTFLLPEDEFIKWYMYKVYRKGKVANGNFENLKLIPKTIKGVAINIQYEKHLLGTTLYVKSPFSNRILTVDTTGKFKSYEE